MITGNRRRVATDAYLVLVQKNEVGLNSCYLLVTSCLEESGIKKEWK